MHFSVEHRWLELVGDADRLRTAYSIERVVQLQEARNSILILALDFFDD